MSRHTRGRLAVLDVWRVLGLVLLLAGPARAQLSTPAPAMPPGGLESLESRRRPEDAGLVSTEPRVQRGDGGDAGTPRFEPPTLVHDSPARYPEALAAQPVAGTVRLELLVDTTGAVEEVRLLEGAHPLLDEAALHAATGLAFTPARVDGTAVSVRLRFEYRFAAPPPGEVSSTGTRLPPVTLRGLVRTKGNRRPLPGALLVFDAAQDAPAETGAEGLFEARLPPGPHTVRITAPGHAPGFFRENIRPGEALRVLYGLEPLVVNPYETVIRGDRERTEVSRVTLHDAELRDIPGTQGDPFRVVMLLPGVSSMLSGVSYPVVRGSQPASTGYFLDGVRVPLLFHLFLGPAVVHPDFIDTLDFYPGNPPTSYGRLTGGAVEGRLTRPRDDRVHGSAYADFLNAGLFLEYPFPSTGTNVSVAGRISYTPWLIALAANGLGASDDSKLVLDFYDYQARVEQTLGAGRLRLFAFGSSDTFGVEATSGTGTTALQSVLFHRLDLRYRHPVAGGELEAGVTAGLDRFGLSALESTSGGTTTNVDQRNLTARLGYERGLGPGLSLRGGLDVESKRALIGVTEFTRVGPPGSFVESQTALPVALATFSGVWGEVTWHARGSPWTLVSGLRLDNYHLSGGINSFVAEPRVSARRQLSEALTLKGGVGLFHQPPTTLISLPIVDIAALGLGLQRVLQVSGGLEYKNLGGLVDVSLDGYVNPMLRTVELTPFGEEDAPFPEVPGVPTDGSPGRPGPTASRTAALRRRALQDEPPFPDTGSLGDFSSRGLSYGLELLLRKPLGGPWFGWLSYSLQRSTRLTRFARFNAVDEPVSQAQAWLPYVFDQTHVAHLVLNYRFSNNVTLGGVLHFNSGRPESGHLTSRTRVEGTDRFGQPRWVRVDLDRVDRLPSFFRLDLRVAKAWAYDTFSVELFLDMLNVTINEEVVSYEYSLYDTPQAARRLGVGGLAGIFTKEPSGVPIALPILGVKGRY